MLGDQTSVNMPTSHCLVGFTQSELLWKIPTNFLVLFFSGQSFGQQKLHRRKDFTDEQDIDPEFVWFVPVCRFLFFVF